MTAGRLKVWNDLEGAWDYVAGGGGSQPVTPSDIDGLQLWLDASDASTINAGSPSDNDPVSAWADKSGNGFDAAQATSDNQPVYHTDLISGLAGVTFDSTENDAFLALIDGLDMLNAAEGITVGVALQPRFDLDESGDYSVFSAGSGTDATKARAQFLPSNEISFFWGVSNDDATNEEETFTTGDVVQVIAQVQAQSCPYATVCAASVVSNQITIETGLVLGWTAPGGTNAITDGPFPATDSLSISIGANQEGPTSYHAFFDLGEIVVYNRMLNASERRQLREYLSAKWDTL